MGSAAAPSSTGPDTSHQPPLPGTNNHPTAYAFYSYCRPMADSTVQTADPSSEDMNRPQKREWPYRAQSYQDGNVAMSSPRPHCMSPRPHSEGLVHSDADGVQNWPKYVARNLWKLNSHLVPNCNLPMWKMLFSVFFYSSSGHIIKNRK